MNISITNDEFSAISDAIDFIETSLEAADESVAEDHSALIGHLYDICNKFKKARAKEADLRTAQKVIRNESKRQLSKSEIQKLARKVIRNMKDETE